MTSLAARSRLKFLAASSGRLEGLGRGLRQPRPHVVSVWRFFPGFVAERFGFVAGIFYGNRSLVGSFAGGLSATARHAARGGVIRPRLSALKGEGEGNGSDYRSPFPHSCLQSRPSSRSLLCLASPQRLLLRRQRPLSDGEPNVDGVLWSLDWVQCRWGGAQEAPQRDAHRPKG